MTRPRPDTTHVLHGFTLLALLAAAAFLVGSARVDGEIPRAFALGAFFFAVLVGILLFVLTKVTERSRRTREYLHHAFEVSNDGFWEWEPAAGRIKLSDRWRRSLGYEDRAADARWAFWTDRLHPDDRDRVLAGLEGLVRGELDAFQSENRLRAAPGSHRWNLTRAQAVARDRDGRALRVIGVDVDVSRLHQLSAQLSYQASHDTLTGLPNRREFERRLHGCIERLGAAPAQHAVCFVDVDQFRVINETCGHMAGDDLIASVARLLRECADKRDTLSRFGGDEFGLLLENCTLEAAIRRARAVVRRVENSRFQWAGKRHGVTVSVGVAMARSVGDTVAGVLREADAACHAAKAKGASRVHVYSAGDADLAERHGKMQWVERIGRALDEQRFVLSYQPIAPVHRAADDGTRYEILVRMRDEDGDIIPPGAFLPAAELYNLASRVDRWVVGATLDWLGAHPAHLRTLEHCGINLSGHSLGADGFLAYVVERLECSGVPAGKLCFEITETAAVADVACASRFIRELRARGARFALDDFGSGLSSFAYLQDLEVDYLKIDGMFVKDMDVDPVHRAMVRSINEIGHVMGLQTVAEFVERDTVLDALRELNVDYAQGYALGRPRPLENLAGPAGEVEAPARPIPVPA